MSNDPESPKCVFSGFTNCTYLSMYDYIYALLEITIIRDCFPNSTNNPSFNSLEKWANNIQQYLPLLGGGRELSSNILHFGALRFKFIKYTSFISFHPVENFLRKCSVQFWVSTLFGSIFLKNLPRYISIQLTLEGYCT